MPESDLPQSTKRRLRPKAYSIAVYVVILFILLEVLFLGFIFWFRQTVIETQAPELPDGVIMTEVKQAPSDDFVPYLPSPEIKGRIPVGKSSDQLKQINKLNEDALTFRRSGDFVLAESALNQALSLDGNHPTTLTNLAMLEEARGNSTKALALWRSILGLKTTPNDTIQLAQKRAQLIEDRIRLEEDARLREQQLLSMKRLMVLEEVKTTPQPLPASPVEIQKDFVLKLNGLKAPVDFRRLKIQLFFYDMIADKRLVGVKVDARFLSGAKPDWSANGREILRVKYVPEKPDNSAEKRLYYGYVLRVFLDGELQEEQAEPSSLLRLFPLVK